MNAAPGVLGNCQLMSKSRIPLGRLWSYLRCSPLHSHHETSYSTSAQEAADVVDLSENFHLRSYRDHPGRIFVEDDAENKSDSVEGGNKCTNLSPGRLPSNQLGPQDRWAEWQNGKYNGTNVRATLSCRDELGGSS